VRILLTGFEPFGGESLNPSREVLRALGLLGGPAPPSPAWRRSGVELVGCELPVRREDAFETLRGLWDAAAFDLWLGLGQAGGRERVCVERTARNWYCAARDGSEAVDSARPEGPPGTGSPDRAGEPLVSGAPSDYRVDWPTERLVDALHAEGWPIQVSDDAGSYVCNALLYRMRHHLDTETAGGRPRSALVSGDSAGAPWLGFVHLPYLPAQRAGKAPEVPSLPLDVQVAVVRRSLDWIVAHRSAASAPAGG